MSNNIKAGATLIGGGVGALGAIYGIYTFVSYVATLIPQSEYHALFTILWYIFAVIFGFGISIWLAIMSGVVLASIAMGIVSLFSKD